jgi:uncharacterized membrane protein
MIPIELFEIQLLLALLCTGYMLFIHDRNNYSDIISGVVGMLFWWTSGLTVLSGVQSENVQFSSSWLMWILIGIGVVVSLITFTKIVDILNSRNHVSMDFNARI